MHRSFFRISLIAFLLIPYRYVLNAQVPTNDELAVFEQRVDSFLVKIADLQNAVQFAEADSLVDLLANEMINRSEHIDDVLFDRFIMSSNDVAFGLKGVQLYAQSIELYEKILLLIDSHPSDGSRNKAKTLANLATTYRRIGDDDSTIRYAKESLALLEVSTFPDSNTIISNLNTLGNLFFTKSELEKALAYFEKAQLIALRMSKSNPLHQIILSSNVANVALQLGEKEKAKSTYLRSLEISLQSEYSTNPIVATTYRNLALSSKDVELSEFYSRKAIEHIRQHNPGNVLEISDIYNNLGVEFGRLRNFERSIANYKKSIAVMKQASSYSLDSYTITLSGLAMSYARKYDFEKSDSLFGGILRDVAYDQVKRFSAVERNTLSRVLYEIAKSHTLRYGIMEDVTDLIASNSFYQQSLAVLSDELFLQKNVKDRQSIIGSLLLRYRNATAVSMTLYEITGEMKYLDQVVGYFNSTKAIQVQDAWTAPSGSDTSAQVIGLRKLEKEVRKQLSATLVKQHRESNKEEKRLAFADDIFEFRLRLDSIADLLENSKENTKASLPSRKMLVEDIQRELVPEDGILIEYLVGTQDILMLAIARDTCLVRQMPIAKPLASVVEELRAAISFPYQTDTITQERPDSRRLQFTSSAYKLYQQLLEPVDSLLAGYCNLIIVPDGVLGYVPFDVLLTEKADSTQSIREYSYLLATHQVSIVYSTALLQQMINRDQAHPPKNQFLGVAPKFFSADSTTYAARQIDFSNSRYSLGNLTHNVAEVEHIQEIMGGHVLTGSAATESTFKAQAKDYSIIHLATHGKSNDEVGDYSFLAFYYLDDSLENEWLYNRELYDLELNADLVVLSACETGIGELQSGEGIISLARGFSYAGAKSIITSLWNVNDAVAPILMESFYTYLSDGKTTKDAALRKAKLDYLATSIDPHPYFWAGFVPIGDMRPIKAPAQNVWLKWVLGLALGVVVVFFTKKFLLKSN